MRICSAQLHRDRLIVAAHSICRQRENVSVFTDRLPLKPEKNSAESVIREQIQAAGATCEGMSRTVRRTHQTM
jgi:hypothetical protein